jgi:hypothetical protein
VSAKLPAIALLKAIAPAASSVKRQSVFPFPGLVVRVKGSGDSTAVVTNVVPLYSFSVKSSIVTSGLLAFCGWTPSNKMPIWLAFVIPSELKEGAACFGNPIGFFSSPRRCPWYKRQIRQPVAAAARCDTAAFGRLARTMRLDGERARQVTEHIRSRKDEIGHGG